MADCKFTKKIDDYLLDRLKKGEKEKFEKHFFNCPICSEELILRNKIFETIKEKGRDIFSDVIIQTHFQPRVSPLSRFAYMLRTKRWAYAFLLSFILVLGGGIYISYKLTHPPFLPPSQEILRGKTLSLISPQGEIQAPPSIFIWEKSDNSAQYVFSVYDERGNILWETKTNKNKIKLPDQVRILLKKGNFYFWEVKVISDQGSVITKSRRAIFKF
mgnify:CR=1 FL=1